MQDLTKLLDLAKRSALEAGLFLKNNFNNSHIKTFDDGRDIKLAIDCESEDLILNIIKSESNLPILSEESGKTDHLGKNFWIVDPLDGTSNYFRKIPLCAVSIALMENNKPVLGVINDFMNEELYYAAKSHGSFCNEKKISVSNITNIEDGTIMTGIPAKTDYTDEEFLTIINLFQSWKKVRMIGSAAIANLFVANGKADCYEENGTFIWDVAAGAILVEEAGGFASLSEIKNDFRVDAKFTNGKVT